LQIIILGCDTLREIAARICAGHILITSEVHVRGTLSVAIIGLIGVFVGSVISVVGTLLLHHLQEKAKAKSDEPRKSLLRDMLRDTRFDWRKIETLSHVIGADEETTKALLIQIGARASEDGTGVWGLLEKHPLPGKQ